MKQMISPRELEQLSAHLDGQLPARQQAALEARLAAEPQLRAALEQLGHTRALLRRAPQRKPRRGFTLSPQMAGEPRRSGLRAWSGFNFASAAAALALMLVLLTDFSVNGLPTPLGTMRAGEAQLMMAQSPAATSELTQSYDLDSATEDSAQGGMPEADPMPPQVTADDQRAITLQADDSLRGTIARNAPALEALLASLAVISGLVAWHRRRR